MRAVPGRGPTRVELRAPDGRVVSVQAFLSRGYADASWSADGTRVLVTVGVYLRVLDTASGAVVFAARLNDPHAVTQAFSPDNTQVLIGDGKRLLRIELASRIAREIARNRLEC